MNKLENDLMIKNQKLMQKIERLEKELSDIQEMYDFEREVGSDRANATEHIQEIIFNNLDKFSETEKDELDRYFTLMPGGEPWCVYDY